MTAPSGLTGALPAVLPEADNADTAADEARLGREACGVKEGGGTGAGLTSDGRLSLALPLALEGALGGALPLALEGPLGGH